MRHCEAEKITQKKKKQEECEGAFSNMLKIIYKSVNKTKQEKNLRIPEYTSK